MDRIVIELGSKVVELRLLKYQDLDSKLRTVADVELLKLWSQVVEYQSMALLAPVMQERLSKELGLNVEVGSLDLWARRVLYKRGTVGDWEKFFTYLGIQLSPEMSLQELTNIYKKTLDKKLKVRYYESVGEWKVFENTVENVGWGRVLTRSVRAIEGEVMWNTIQSVQGICMQALSDQYGVYFFEDGTVCPIDVCRAVYVDGST